jgi:hypothetical protein
MLVDKGQMKLVSVSGERKDGFPKIVHFTTLEQ